MMEHYRNKTELSEHMAFICIKTLGLKESQSIRWLGFHIFQQAATKQESYFPYAMHTKVTTIQVKTHK